MEEDTVKDITWKNYTYKDVTEAILSLPEEEMEMLMKVSNMDELLQLVNTEEGQKIHIDYVEYVISNFTVLDQAFKNLVNALNTSQAGHKNHNICLDSACIKSEVMV